MRLLFGACIAAAALATSGGTLTLDSKMSATYSVSADSVNFTVTLADSGWLGLGVSADGTMGSGGNDARAPCTSSSRGSVCRFEG